MLFRTVFFVASPLLAAGQLTSGVSNDSPGSTSDHVDSWLLGNMSVTGTSSLIFSCGNNAADDLMQQNFDYFKVWIDSFVLEFSSTDPVALLSSVALQTMQCTISKFLKRNLRKGRFDVPLPGKVESVFVSATTDEDHSRRKQVRQMEVSGQTGKNLHRNVENSNSARIQLAGEVLYIENEGGGHSNDDGNTSQAVNFILQDGTKRRKLLKHLQSSPGGHAFDNVMRISFVRHHEIRFADADFPNDVTTPKASSKRKYILPVVLLTLAMLLLVFVPVLFFHRKKQKGKSILASSQKQKPWPFPYGFFSFRKWIKFRSDPSLLLPDAESSASTQSPSLVSWESSLNDEIQPNEERSLTTSDEAQDLEGLVTKTFHNLKDVSLSTIHEGDDLASSYASTAQTVNTEENQVTTKGDGNSYIVQCSLPQPDNNVKHRPQSRTTAGVGETDTTEELSVSQEPRGNCHVMERHHLDSMSYSSLQPEIWKEMNGETGKLLEIITRAQHSLNRRQSAKIKSHEKEESRGLERVMDTAPAHDTESTCSNLTHETFGGYTIEREVKQDKQEEDVEKDWFGPFYESLTCYKPDFESFSETMSFWR